METIMISTILVNICIGCFACVGLTTAGTCTPDGDYDSQAVALANKYMSRYAGFKKYTYRPSCGNYIRRGNYMRWYSSTLSDPDNFKNKTADVILRELFGF